MKLATIWNGWFGNGEPKPKKLSKKEFRRQEAAIVDRAPRVISELEKIYEQVSANTEQIERIVEGEETGDIDSLAKKVEALTMENKRLRDEALVYKKEMDDLVAKQRALYNEPRESLI